jgi:sugar phosphate isomerase/epimerase
MKSEQIAAQLFTLRNYLQKPAQVPDTMRRIAQIGFRAVQVSGVGPDVPDELIVESAAVNGLTICASHDPGAKILNDPASVAERLKKLGCIHTAYPSPKEIDLTSESSVREWIAKLNHAGRVLADKGMTLSYHNHHYEFRKLGGRRILDRIYEETDPSWLKAELDTYWIQYGGGDPSDWCRKMAGRMNLIHLKDYMIDQDSKATFTELGNGNLNFNTIIPAAESGGCEWFIIEQDSCPGNPFDALQRSFEYMQRWVTKGSVVSNSEK